MPMVIPVVAGAWTMYAAAGAAMTVASGLAFAGGFLTVVGGISGDKDAMKLGSMLGLAGALPGALTSSAGGSSVAAEAAAETANATAGSTVTDAVGNVATEQAVNQAADLAGSGNDLGLFNELGGSPATEGLVSGAAPDLAGAATNDLGLFNDAAAGATPLAPEAAAGSGGLIGDQTKSALFGSQGYGDGMSGAATGAFDKGVGEASKFGSLSDMFSSTENWMKQNPNLAKLGTGIIKGAADYMGDRQQLKDRMNAEKSYRDWVRQRYSDSVRNLVIPSPVSTAAGPSGIIAGQRG